MNDETTDLLCPHCGQTFSAFLHEMADHNAKVVCPSCGKAPDGKPAKAAKPVVGARPVKRTH
jgi:endogenous inhibitor of DNA gyrase (YacG/DUF329 family)